jgi:hypothetical protein
MVSLPFDKLRASGSIKPLMVSESNHEQDTLEPLSSFDSLRMSGEGFNIGRDPGPKLN